MRQRFRVKKQKNILKRVVFIAIFLITFSFTFKYLDKINININNEEFLRNLIYQSNHNIDYNYDKKSIMTKMITFFSNVNFDKPVSILNNNYTGLVDIDSENISVEEANNMSDYIDDPYNKKVNEPLVYIYNTHQRENYRSTSLAEYSVTPNVMMASYILREKLDNYHIKAIVEENDVTNILNTNGWSYSYSYAVTRMLLEEAKKNNKSLKYYIDIHRDSVSYDKTLVSKDNKDYARIMFIVGLENPKYEENLQVTTAINNMLEKEVPGISRGIYKKEGPGVNGIYNQDFDKFVILVEMGGVENKIEEVLNSTELLAKVLYKYIGDSVEGK